MPVAASRILLLARTERSFLLVAIRAISHVLHILCSPSFPPIRTANQSTGRVSLHTQHAFVRASAGAISKFNVSRASWLRSWVTLLQFELHGLQYLWNPRTLCSENQRVSRSTPHLLHRCTAPDSAGGVRLQEGGKIQLGRRHIEDFQSVPLDGLRLAP